MRTDVVDKRVGGGSAPADSAFDLPQRLAAKADPALIEDDERHFADIARALEEQIADLTRRLDAERRAPGGTGQAAMDRDLEIHRLTGRLRLLRRFGLDLCLGRMVPEGGGDDGRPVYVGRLGLTDRAGRRLLIDWRTPAAEPFFGATHGSPMGLASRRRYRWSRGRISDYWDEVFAPGAPGHAALDDPSAFIASLGSSRSPRMRDVLSTIQADQDAIIRAGSRGALVVDGGPGTGKTVVALHRAAYLLYADPRLGHHRGEVLFVGPHQPYLAYVSDVLPSLGEEGVQTCILRDLVPEGATATAEADPAVARLKGDARLVSAIEPAVGLYEQPPAEGMTVETPWADVWLGPADWVEAFGFVEPGTPHNEARDQIREALLAILVDRLDDATAPGADDEGELPAEQLRRSLVQDRGLAETFERAWPLLEATDLVGDLWSVPAYLRMCAPWLGPDEVRALQREDPGAWTASDLPLLDAARQRLGDATASRRVRQREAAVAAEREQRDRVLDHLIAADDSEMQVMSMLRGEDLQDALDDDSALPTSTPHLLAGPFAHIVVDEAQELTDAEWRMLLSRCPSRSLTVVGDRAQARIRPVLAAATRRDRARRYHRGHPAHQLPDPGGGHGAGRTGHPGGAPGRQRAHLDPQHRHPGGARCSVRAGRDPGRLARRARRRGRLRDRRSHLRGLLQSPLARAGERQGPRVRPGGAGRPRPFRHRARRRGGSLRGHDPSDPAAGHPHQPLTPELLGNHVLDTVDPQQLLERMGSCWETTWPTPSIPSNFSAWPGSGGRTQEVRGRCARMTV